MNKTISFHPILYISPSPIKKINTKDASGGVEVEGAKMDTSRCKVTTDESQNMFNTVCKDGCISCRYEVEAIDLILKTATNVTNSKYRKKKLALHKKIHDKLFNELQVRNDESVQMMVGKKKMLEISEAKMTSRNLLELENDSLVAVDKENLNLNQRFEYPECLKAIRIRNLYGPVPELPSILLKSTKYKFYRNGCTHGLHSSERNILDTELSLSRQPNDASGTAKVEGDLSTCKATIDEAAKMFSIMSNIEYGCINCLHEVQTFDLILKAAKTAINTKYRKKKFVSSKKIPERLFRKLHETPVVTQSEPTPKSVQNGTDQPSEDPTSVAPKWGKTSKTSDYNKPILLPELKITDATSTGCSSLQFFKYTFQRKRKRETVRISDENI